MTMCKHTHLLEPKICDDCDDARKILNGDAKAYNLRNYKEARKIKEAIKRYINMHPGCTAQDIYSDPVLQPADIPMYIALHLLIEQFEIMGPDPYAPAAGKRHNDWVYHPRNIDVGGPEDLATR
jgi:hypothetical protein